MKLTQLRYFQTICKHSNITRAAAELHVSQPSLSNAVRELEEEFGVSLFYRLSKGLVLTEEGELFLQESAKLLDQVNQLAAIYQLIDHGAAASFLFEDDPTRHPGIIAVPVPDLPPIHVSLIWNSNRILAPGTRKLIQLAKAEYPRR